MKPFVRLTFAALLQALATAMPTGAEQAPPLWGYGVKSCDDYVRARDGWEQGLEAQIAEYRRYEDWLTGLVSGLNLATGRDVLAGVEISAAMRRIHLYCADRRKEDFFTASMDLVRLLSQLR
jgi:hypothetical protein